MPQTRLSGLREFETFVETEVEKKVALSVRDLSKWYGNEQILDNVSFSVAEGESLVLLGPSGSGKSTTLRLIAGLDTPDGGDVFLGGRHIEHLRARERNIGVIFQNYALFPRMTIADNIAFGLRIRGKGKKQRQDVVEKLLVMIGLSDQRNKYPAQLSGGQQQRVAIARALAYEPDLLLFDESFSALDPQTRTGLRREIRSLLRKLKVPALFITHDQEEAMELGDHIAILNKGRLEQIGTPQEVYNNPQTEFVATFLGAANVVELCRNDRFVALDCRQCLTQMPSEMAMDRAKIVFRPEDVLLSPALGLAEPHDHLGIGEVQDIAFTGATEIVKVKLQRLNPPSHPAALDCQPPSDQACDLIIKALRTKWEAQRVPLNPGEPVSVWLRDHKVL